ncbi:MULTISPECIES: hypothetical protein [unclassified Spirosoma]|uniref:ArnT family glycosyltransferase n=1 Tax=unclassified Spirosoma TaxID=2621999 RepID=UPI0009695986|nr:MULTISPECIES: hypothetical protein [unclassified Spirosoma]MBN8824106.1 hypothetical protein [Spirosoma sp.]OJW70500.1 MAG: hypothetical protein BGO59_24975 [Spirosoma sp. 48-14]
MTPILSIAKNNILQISLGLLLIGCLLITLIIRYRLIFLTNSDIGGIESNVIYAIQRFLAGYPLYSNPEIAPYSITQYSPFYYRVVGTVCKLASLNPDHPIEIYRASRVVSLCANLLFAFLLFGIGRIFQLKLKTALAVSVIAFVLLPPQTYSRPDSIYILFVLATLYTGTRSIQDGSPKARTGWLIVAVLTTALAIATKQSGIVLPAILTSFYLVWSRQWLKALIVGGCSSLLGLLLLVGFMPEHDLHLLYTNIVTGVSQGLDWTSYKVNIFDHYLRPYGLHNAFGLALSIWLLRRTKLEHKWLGWFTLLLFGFALLTSLKQGSALNYFAEFIALTGLIVAIWLQTFLDTSNGRQIGLGILIFSAVFWAVIPNISNFNWPLALRRDALSENPYYEQKRVADYITDSLHLQPTDAVFITNYNYCYLNGLLYRNCILPQQEIVMVMYHRHELSYAAFDKQIREGKIRFLITRPKETVTPFPGLTTVGYTLRHQFSDFDVYERTSNLSLRNSKP